MTLWDQGMSSLQWGAVLGASLAAALCDVRTRRIPNWLAALTLIGGLTWAAVSAGTAGLGDGLLACVMLAAPYVLLFVIGAGGAGDAKFMGALGAWLGVMNGIVVLACVIVSGGVLAMAWAVAGRRLRPVLANVWRITYGFILIGATRGRCREIIVPSGNEMQSIPYGIAIFTGTCIAAGGLILWRA